MLRRDVLNTKADTIFFLWTFSAGSLTSPPCTEGIRFFVARNILFVGNAQMQDILNVSTYSARAEQEVWLHQINV
jgi:carbonic anhydrase